MGCFGSRVAFFRSCTFSRSSSRQSSRRQTIFTVQNVDDLGQGVSPGKLEVTETDLVLHVKGKPSLTWPLRCLRRYGYDNDLFSFESGRRCPTGAGIFAFRCHRAQSLFNLLQAKIQGNPGALPTVPSTPITPPNVGTPINVGSNPATTPSSTFVYVNLSESNSSRLLSGSSGGGAASFVPPPSGSDPPDVVQTPASSKEPSGGARVPALISGKPASSSSENHPVYVNVESHGGALFASNNYQNSLSSIPPPTAPRRSTLSSELPTVVKIPARPISSSSASSSATCLLSTAKANPECALYSNVFCNHSKKGATSSYLTSVKPLSVVPIQQEPPEINYAELDLKTDRPSSSSSNNSPRSGRLGLLAKQIPPSSSVSTSADPLASASTNRLGSSTKSDYVHPRLTKSQQQNNGDLGYATIDFDKTAALSCITRSKINLGFGDGDGGGSSSSSKKSRHSTTGLWKVFASFDTSGLK